MRFFTFYNELLWVDIADNNAQRQFKTMLGMKQYTVEQLNRRTFSTFVCELWMNERWPNHEFCAQFLVYPLRLWKLSILILCVTELCRQCYDVMNTIFPVEATFSHSIIMVARIFGSCNTAVVAIIFYHIHHRIDSMGFDICHRQTAAITVTNEWVKQAFDIYFSKMKIHSIPDRRKAPCHPYAISHIIFARDPFFSFLFAVDERILRLFIAADFKQ